MQRTQIYLEENLLIELKRIAKNLNISMSELIRDAVRKELKRYKQNSLSQFIDNLEPLESFKNIEPNEYVDEIRNKSRIVK
jgi:Arc/MetJ-type ribon-helix-helix transcriptional regulator